MSIVPASPSKYTLAIQTPALPCLKKNCDGIDPTLVISLGTPLRNIGQTFTLNLFLFESRYCLASKQTRHTK